MSENSEFRLYPFIEKSLFELGWDIRNPLKHSSGEVFSQNEALHDRTLSHFYKIPDPNILSKFAKMYIGLLRQKLNRRSLKKL